MESRGRVRLPPPLLCVSEALDQASSSNSKPDELMSTAHHRWLEYRDERTSSSSSDSGVAVQFSPPNNLLSHSVSSFSSVLALSPPGLSPLTVHDSAFSTPTVQQGNRFTFDHVPFQRDNNASQKESHSPRMDVISGQDTLRSVLCMNQSSDENKHTVLQRKQSVIQSTRNDQRMGQGTDNSAVPPSLIRPLSVHVADNEVIDRMINNTQLLLGSLCPSRHSLLSPSLSSPLSSSTDSYHLGVSPTLRLSPLSDKSTMSLSSETLDDDDKKQYYCHICKKDFKRPDILSRHLRRHTGEKPFGCDACGRFFSRSDHLRTHRRTHTDEKPYQCTICPYAARRRDVLTRHMSTRHQAKAGASVFQKHRDVRRCLSDGAQALTVSPRVSVFSPPNTPKRVRRMTEMYVVEERTRDRTLTEVPCARDRQMSLLEDKNDHDGFPSLHEMEDDVIIDLSDVEDDDNTIE